MEHEIAVKIDDIDMLRAEIKKRDETIDTFFLNKGAESTYKLEIHQLKEDNQRLIKLLKKTKEYKEFTDYIDDSGGVRNIDKENKQGT